jgi:hypothetical protein
MAIICCRPVFSYVTIDHTADSNYCCSVGLDPSKAEALSASAKVGIGLAKLETFFVCFVVAVHLSTWATKRQLDDMKKTLRA